MFETPDASRAKSAFPCSVRAVWAIGMACVFSLLIGWFHPVFAGSCTDQGTCAGPVITVAFPTGMATDEPVNGLLHDVFATIPRHVRSGTVVAVLGRHHGAMPARPADDARVMVPTATDVATQPDDDRPPAPQGGFSIGSLAVTQATMGIFAPVAEFTAGGPTVATFDDITRPASIDYDVYHDSGLTMRGTYRGAFSSTQSRHRANLNIVLNF